MPTRRTKRRIKRRALSTIYEEKPSETKRRSSPNRTLKKNNQPRLLPRGQRRNTIRMLVIENTHAQKKANEQLGCFGKFCKNIKSKLTRRARRAGRAGTRAGTRRRRGTRKKRKKRTR